MESQGIFRGQSVLLLGEGHSDASGGERISVSAGDVVVLPAGTAHSSVTSTDDYRYVGVYPKVSTAMPNTIIIPGFRKLRGTPNTGMSKMAE